MKKFVLTFVILSTSVEAFTPVVSKNSKVTQLSAKSTSVDLGAAAKGAIASALSFSLLFGPTPALADGK